MSTSLNEQLLKVCHDVLVPLIEADGGKLSVIDIDNETVELHLSGTCAGCPGAGLTTRSIIEPAIRAIAPNARVIVSAGFDPAVRNARRTDPVR